MSDFSVDFSVRSPDEGSITVNANEYHPAAIVTTENAPISPNTVLATLAAHDNVPTESLHEIITGLVATIKIREVAWEAN